MRFVVKFNWLFRWIEFEWIEIDKCQSLCLIIGQLFHHVTEQFINCSHSEPTSQVSIAVVLASVHLRRNGTDYSEVYEP